MPFEKGNQYWKKRSKHGRDAIIKSHEILADASDEYFQWCVDNPIMEVDFRGRDLTEVKIPHPRVFKKEELSRFCGVSAWRTINDLKNKNDDFFQVITRIEGIIADQKYTYAVVGMFNSTIVARDLGLADKKDIDSSVNLKTSISEESTDDLIKRAQAVKAIEGAE